MSFAERHSMHNELWLIDDNRILDRRLGAWWLWREHKSTLGALSMFSLIVTDFTNAYSYEITLDALAVWTYLRARALDVRKGY